MKELADEMTQRIYYLVKSGGSNQANEVQDYIYQNLKKIYQKGVEDAKCE